MRSSRKHLLIIMIIAIGLAMTASLVYVNAATTIKGTGRVNSCDGVNVRSSSSTSSSIITALSDNTKVNLLGIIFKSTTSTSATKKWFKVSVNGKTGYIRSDLIDSISYPGVKAVTTASVNYRVGAGIKMTKKGTFKKGTEVTICLKATPVSSTAGTSKTWYMVKVGSKRYYAVSTYFKIKTSSQVDTIEDKSTMTTPVFTKSKVVHPDTINVGDAFTLSGTVKCDKTIKKVTFGIKDAEDDWMMSTTKTVDAKSFDISRIDANVKFGRIAPGTYRYVGIFYVGNSSYKKINYQFTVVAKSTSLTKSVVKTRINQMLESLEGYYFTTDGKACSNSSGSRCMVDNVVRDNTRVKKLVKTNKGEGKIDPNLFPYHYGPSGGVLIKGWSCCGFASFAGWYVGAKSINSDVNYVMVKTGCAYSKENIQKYAKIGDVLRSDGHSFMIVGIYDNGCDVLDSNWDKNCIVSKHRIKWGDYTSVTISRATNRA